MTAESINNHESQGSMKDLISSHSGANDLIMLTTDTISEQHYDVITPPDISNNIQMFDGPRICFSGRMQKLSRKLKDCIPIHF